MTSIIFMLFGFLGMIICYLKSRDILHPLGIGVLLWFLAASLSNVTSFYDRTLQSPISVETNIAILLAGISFTLPIFLSSKINKDRFIQQQLYFGMTYKFFYGFFIILSIMAFILRFKNELFSPALFYGSGFDLKQSVPDALPILNFADISIPFLAIISFWELKNSAKCSIGRRFVLLLFIFFVVVCLLVFTNGSRTARIHSPSSAKLSSGSCSGEFKHTFFFFFSNLLFPTPPTKFNN